MAIKSFKELYKTLKETGFTKTLDNIVTGEEYEDWNKDRFIKEIDFKHRKIIEINIKIIKRNLLEIKEHLKIEEIQDDELLKKYLDYECLGKLKQCKKYLEDSIKRIEE